MAISLGKEATMLLSALRTPTITLIAPSVVKKATEKQFAGQKNRNKEFVVFKIT